MTNKIKIAEIFNSIQGEGLWMGVPSLFVRTFGCNFTCSGFGMLRGEKSTERFGVDPSAHSNFATLPLVTTGCDSYASWDPRFKDLSPMLEIPSLVDRIQELLPTGKFHQDQHLILTGGEPLLGWQRSYPRLLDEIIERKMNLTDLTFETNGTQLLSSSLFDFLDDAANLNSITTTFSVSAKLPDSGQTWKEAILPDRIAQYQKVKNSNVYLKFVVSTPQDILDVDKAVAEYRAGGFSGSVYLMPVGGVASVYNLNAKNVAEMALSKGYRYSARLQVDLFKNQWGT